ncbi:hypothetical protein [Photorhabdus akhurstii]|uniref:hypothetical protein n=1 Tax=Photorhabdus akhurstii TaxID=171438 RepID=UPI003703CF25
MPKMGIDELLENEQVLNIVSKSLGYSKEQFIKELHKAQADGLDYIKFEADNTEEKA